MPCCSLVGLTTDGLLTGRTVVVVVGAVVVDVEGVVVVVDGADVVVDDVGTVVVVDVVVVGGGVTFGAAT